MNYIRLYGIIVVSVVEKVFCYHTQKVREQKNHKCKEDEALLSMPIKSSGRIAPPGWAPLQPKQSVLSLIV